MRRLACLVGVFTVLFLAAPAAAQELRDPFDPLLTTGGSDTTDTVPPTSDTPVTTPPTENPLETPTPTDNLPTTGSDPKSWLALGYFLLAAGTTMIAMARVAEHGARRTA